MLVPLALLVLAAAPEEDVLPSDVSRQFAAAHGALRSGDDEAAMLRWKKARAAFDALPAGIRIDPAVRDAAVRRELWLAEQVKQRFDAIAVPANVEDAATALAEKHRLFVMLVGSSGALEDDFAGAYRRITTLKPSLRGIHCQWGDVLARYQRWLEQLPCPAGVDAAQCTALHGAPALKDEIARQQAACRM
jgi:hypothetical protein